MVILSGVTLPRACFQTCFRNFLRKVITIRLLEAIVGIYWIKERGYFILFDNFDITWSVYGKNINYN